MRLILVQSHQTIQTNHSIILLYFKNSTLSTHFEVPIFKNFPSNLFFQVSLYTRTRFTNAVSRKTLSNNKARMKRGENSLLYH